MTIEKKLLHAKNTNNKEKINSIFEEIFKEYSRLVGFIIYKYVHKKEDVEDLVMNVFMKFYKSAIVGDIENIKNYLVVSSKNEAINFIKKVSNDSIIYDEKICFTVPSNGNSYYDIIDDMKRVLDEEEIDIILLHTVYGHSFVEMGKMLNSPPTTINSKYHRAIKKFRKGLR